MRGLERLGPWVDVPEIIVLSFPTEWARRSPGLDDEFVGLLETLPIVRGRRIVRDALSTCASDPSGDQSAMRNHVNHRKLFDQP